MTPVSSAAWSRIKKGVKAQGFTQLSQLLIRMLEVPIFLSFWSSAKYGQWLVLISVPTYLALADGGFSTAAGRDMTMRLARGDIGGAKSVFQSVFILLLAISALMLIGWWIVLRSFPVEAWLLPRDVPDSESGAALLVLMVYIAAVFQTSLLYGCYCAAGRYGDGGFYMAFIQIFEFLASSAALMLGGGMYWLSIVMLGGRLIGALYMYYDLHRTTDWVRFGFSQASLSNIRMLIGPAISALTLPIAGALNLQGTRIIIGIYLGAGAVASFSAARTLVRGIMQPASIVPKVAEPELAMAFGAGDRRLLSKIFIRMCQISIWTAVLCALLSVCFSRYLFETWTHKAIEFKWSIYGPLLVGAALNSVWSTVIQIAYATNRAKSVALLTLVVYGIAGVILSCALVKTYGLVWIGLSLLIVELLMPLFVLPLILGLVDQRLSYWTAMMFDYPRQLVREISARLIR